MIDTFVIKVSSRCNLRCSYCYEYGRGDETWREKPKLISSSVLKRLGERISEYGVENNLQSARIVLHGGEPLLIGSKKLEEHIITLLKAASPVKLGISIQTNGILITEEICNILSKYGISVGISLDGLEEANKMRIFPNGDRAYPEIMAGISTLREHAPECFSGVLSVVNTDEDPKELVEFVSKLGPKTLDLLQPFMSHDQAGPNREAISNRFGAWMIAAMDHWLANQDLHKLKIRVFEDALQAVITKSPKTDWFGKRRISYLIIESDGRYDLLDQLKAVGAESMQLRDLFGGVFNMSLKHAEDSCLSIMSKYSAIGTPDDCYGCTWEGVCAAGHLPSRYSRVKHFNNRSVYCEGIYALLERAREVMADVVIV